MTVQTSHHYRSSGGIQSPIDDQMYDLLQALTSKCEAIEAYAKYEQDSDDQAKSLFQELGEQDAQAAERLLEAVRARLQTTAGSRSMSSEPVPA
jgi:rubrerythrin